MPAKLDVVDVLPITILEGKDQLVLRPVEAALAWRRFRPHDEVLELGIDGRPGRKKLAEVAPIHEHEVDRAADGVLAPQARAQLRRNSVNSAGDISPEACAKFPVLDPTAALNPLDRQVVGRIGDHHRRRIGPHEAPHIDRGLGVAAEQPMRSKLP